MKRFLSAIAILSAALAAGPAWADKVAVLPFTSVSTQTLPKPELEQARAWARDAVVKKGHTPATPDEMVSAEAAVRDGVPDTSQEYIAAGKAVSAPWTLAAHVERSDVAATTFADGTTEDGYTTYRIELEACFVASGRVESLSREVLPGDADAIAEMIALLVRPEGLANADVPWQRDGTPRPKPKPKPPEPKKPAPPPEPIAPPEPPKPPAPRAVYGEKHPLALGLSMGLSGALARPDEASGSSLALPIGGVIGIALPETLPGLELRAQIVSHVAGPRALEVAAGARYAFAPLGNGVRLFMGPELLLGGHVALGAERTARFLTHGAFFVAYGLTENLQAEVAGDLAAAAGGSGALVLGGATARILLRF